MWLTLGAALCTIQSMKTKNELLQKATGELVQIILDFQVMVVGLKEEIRQLKDELAKTKKSRPGQK